MDIRNQVKKAMQELGALMAGFGEYSRHEPSFNVMKAWRWARERYNSKVTEICHEMVRG